MILGLAGLHGSGKTFIRERLAALLPSSVLFKRGVVMSWYEGGNRRVSEGERISWYQAEYKRLGAYRIMSMILQRSYSASQGITLIDAIHNPQEWYAVREVDSASMLVGVFAPEQVRNARNEREGDERGLDYRRTTYWHEEGARGKECLMQYVEWAFAGCLDLPEVDRQCLALRSYLQAR